MRYGKIILPFLAALMITGCGQQGPSELEMARNDGISYMEQAQYQQAVESFEKAYELCDEKMPETKTDISLYEAACQLKLEEYDSVRETCTRILTLGDSAEAYYMRGVAFLHSREMDAAKADFDCAAERRPRDYSMFLNIYQQYEQINQSAVGDEYLQKALSIPEEGVEDEYQKGCIYFYLKDYTKAQEMLAAPVEAKNENAMMLMGQVYLELGDSVHARNVYQQYMDSFGENAKAYNGMALCDLADGAYDAALENIWAGLALEGEENRQELLFNEIVAYERKEDFETAKAKASEYVELYPGDEAGKKEYDFLITR